MKKSISVFSAIALALAVFFHHGAAFARKWKPTTVELAQDYLTIDHGITKTEKVMLIWFAPEYFPNDAATAPVRDVLEKYAMVGIIHFSIDKFGVFDIKEPQQASFRSGNSAKLLPMPINDIPPVAANIVDLLKRVMSGGLGKVGQGLTIYMFDDDSLERCSEGVVTIQYLQEEYTFNTPIPGCQ